MALLVIKVIVIIPGTLIGWRKLSKISWVLEKEMSNAFDTSKKFKISCLANLLLETGKEKIPLTYYY